MKIQAVSSSYAVNQKNLNQKTLGIKDYNTPPLNYNNFTTMSFGGTNPQHGIFVGAEIKGLQQKGGVATVMFDYASIPGMEEAIVLPYHNAQLTYDSQGKYAGEVKVHRFPQGHEHAGKPFWTGADLDKTSLQEVYSDPKKYILLDEISTVKAPWDSTQNATLFRIQQKGAIKGINQDVFLIFSDTLGTMKEPYADGAYMTKSAQEAVADAAKRKFEPSPYAEFNRLFVEFQDAIVKNTRTGDGSAFSPMTVSCSDSQTAYIPYYMRAKNIQDMLPIYTLHNGGDGYTGQTDGKTMFQNLLLASDEKTRKEVIKNLLENKEYLLHAHNGTTDVFFKQFMPQLVDASGSFNPTLIPFMYALKDDRYVKGINTVSKGYAEGMAFNEAIPSGIRPFFKSLLKDGMADGVLNPMNDVSFNPFEGKGGYLPGYNKEYTIKYADGTEETIKPFRLLNEKMFTNVTEDSLRHYDEVKLDNQINFFKRVLGTYDADNFKGEIGNLKGEKVRNLLINGLEGKDVELIGHVSPEMLQKFEAAKAGKGKAPNVFVSWGRIDDQKALDSVMKAFAKFKETHNDAVLVLGGPSLVDAEGNVADCTKKTIDLVNKYVTSEELKGHLVFMNGFAPNKVLAAIADAAVFPSRFAPCELTDLESMKYFLRVIASNCQGLADKNFDATMDGAENATGYKTIHEFFGINQTTIEQDNAISKLFREGITSERLTGFNKLYADAEKEYLARTGNSNLVYRNMIAENLAKELSETLDDNTMKTVKTVVAKLKLTDKETAKLKALPITEAADRTLITKFADNKKLAPQEAAKIIDLINTTTLDAGEKTRFIQLLDGTANSAVEKDLFNLLFNAKNLKDKKIKLTGPAITEEGLNLIKTYLSDTSQVNRKLLDENLLEKGIIDEKQLDAAKRIFAYDPVINYLHDTPKFQNKYKALIERCRNEIMEAEIFRCMQRAANETPEMRLQMLKNHVLLNSSWDGNAKLTGVTRENGTKKVSSYYLYNEMFQRTRTADQKKKPFVNFLQQLMDKIKPKKQPAPKNDYEEAAEVVQEAVKTASGMSKGAKIALGAGAALVALGGAYFAMNKSGSKSNEHGDTFKPSNPAKQPAQQPKPALNNQYLATK